MHSPLRLDFRMEEQAKTCLCWAAVGSALSRFYHSSEGLSQTEVVVKLLGRYESKLYSASKTLESLGLLRGVVEGPLPPADIRKEIEAGYVVAVQIAWVFGGNHLVTVSGIDGTNRVWIDDPRVGSGWLPYADLVSDAMGWSRWTKTFLTGSISVGNADTR